jgi:hypothetical protein
MRRTGLVNNALGRRIDRQDSASFRFGATQKLTGLKNADRICDVRVMVHIPRPPAAIRQSGGPGSNMIFDDGSPRLQCTGSGNATSLVDRGVDAGAKRIPGTSFRPPASLRN